MNDDPADVPVGGCEDLGGRRSALSEAPKVRRGSSAQEGVFAACFDRRQVARFLASGAMPNPIDPTMKRDKGTSFQTASNLVDRHSRPEQLGSSHHSVGATRDIRE
jgi:hypothetical protein